MSNTSIPGMPASQHHERRERHFDWYGVGSGDYFFYFSKAFDGQTVKCDAMGMYSW